MTTLQAEEAELQAASAADEEVAKQLQEEEVKTNRKRMAQEREDAEAAQELHNQDLIEKRAEEVRSALPTCPICLEAIEDARTHNALPCGHSFHTSCLVDLAHNALARGPSVTCPVCRKKYCATRDRWKPEEG